MKVISRLSITKIREGEKMLFVKGQEQPPLPIAPLDAAAPAQTQQATFALG